LDASLEAEAAPTSRRTGWAILAVVVAAFVAVGVGLFRATPAEVRKPAPGFLLPSLQGPSEIRLEQFRGRLLVMNFWASWCAPCREEASLFAGAARDIRDVAFLGIDVFDGREDAVRFVEEFRLPYPQAVDHRGIVLRRYRVTGVPETFFIDRTGRIVGHFIGAFRGTQLDDAIRRFKRLGPDGVLHFKQQGEQRPVG
jgi:cytochrome c biogenesis protein CcmG/thiol:disulfide interchange protein DsbE